MENPIEKIKGKGAVSYILKDKDDYLTTATNENLVVCQKILSFLSNDDTCQSDFILVVDENSSSALYDNQANPLVA